MKGRKILSALLGVIVFLVFAAVNVNADDYQWIQDLINAANYGETVFLAGGEPPVVYKLSRPIMMKNGVSLVKEGEGVCILERDTQIEGIPNAVIICDGIDENTIIEGFTITHTVGLPGRGIICRNSSFLTIRKNVIIGNGTGGIACNTYSSPTITNNIIRENHAFFDEDKWQNGGGGILCKGFSSPTITNNVISGNSVSYIERETESDQSGGGIKCAQSSDATIINNIITNNSVSYSHGGGISSMLSSPVIINNTIANNTATYNGGGIACEGIYSYPESTITNNIITGNTALKGGGIYCESSSPVITYNNVWNNTKPNYTISNYFGYEPVGTDNNISDDPLFVDPNPVSGNYHLQDLSPCIDKGNDAALPLDTADLDGDGDTTEPIPFDIEGNPRILDGDYVEGDRVDMGAYEFVPQANNPPVAVADDYSVDEDEILSVPTTEIDGVLENDSDDDGDTLTAVLVNDVSDGTLSLSSDGSFTYEPDDDFNGTDTFTYMANDGQADSEATATVTITVNPVNDLPVAEDQLITPNEDTAILFKLIATDVDEDSLDYSVVTGPLKGTLSGNAPDLTYTPDLNYHGGDILTFKAKDGEDFSNVATVTITITSVNDSPVADAGSYPTIAVNDECEAEVTLDGTGSYDVEDDHDPLTPLAYAWVWDGPFGQGQASGEQPTVTLGKGTHEIILTVEDSSGATATDTVQITVEDQTPPVISLSGPILDSVRKGKGKGKKVNKLTVSATDNCSLADKISIDINVEIFNKKGRPPKGKGVYYIIDGNDIYVFPKKKKWIIHVTVTATDESGNSVTEIFDKTLLKSKGWSWKSFFKLLLWKCFH